MDVGGGGTGRRPHRSKNCWEKYLSQFSAGLGDPPDPPKANVQWKTQLSPWLAEQFPGQGLSGIKKNHLTEP